MSLLRLGDCGAKRHSFARMQRRLLGGLWSCRPVAVWAERQQLRPAHCPAASPLSISDWLRLNRHSAMDEQLLGCC